MNKEKLFELYEKSYFHEMEVRERITGRVQVTFALVATAYTILSYMLRMIDFEARLQAVILFFILTLFSFLISFVSIYNLIQAFWGSTYHGLPTAKETDEYRTQLLNHNIAIEEYNNTYPHNQQSALDVDQSVTDYLYEKFRDCSTHNAKINDKRSKWIYQAFRWLLWASVPIILACITFIGFDLDTSSPRKESAIISESITESLDSIKLELKKLNRQQN